MASIGSISGSSFIGCPIVVPVTPGSPAAGATFHRVCLQVSVGNSTFDFSSPADGGTIMFDVSSALRAIAEQHVYTANGLNGYVSLSFTCEAWDEWMVDGQISSHGRASSGMSGLYAGTLTDRERLYGRASNRFSRKPTTSPEIAFTDYTAIVPGSGTPSVSTVTVPSGLATGYNIYGVPATRDGYEIRFINGLGVHENVFVTCLRTAEVGIQTTRYAISRQETLTDFSRGITAKQNNHERWKMATYPLDEAWQQWYLHEFLMARWAWISVPASSAGGSSAYLPIHIIPDETVHGIDRQKADPLTVEFTIEFDITGSPTI